ncbi:MAG: hypothetical protein WCO97_10660, partial [bacterium]
NPPAARSHDEATFGMEQASDLAEEFRFATFTGPKEFSWISNRLSDSQKPYAADQKNIKWMRLAMPRHDALFWKKNDPIGHLQTSHSKIPP